MNVVVLPGDGIGPEVTAGAVAVLERMAQRHGLPLTLTEDLVGGASIEAHGSSLRPEAPATITTAFRTAMLTRMTLSTVKVMSTAKAVSIVMFSPMFIPTARSTGTRSTRAMP